MAARKCSNVQWHNTSLDGRPAFWRELGMAGQSALGCLWFGVANFGSYGCSDVLEAISRQEIAKTTKIFPSE
jgi:hypothetical protein